MTIYYVNPLTGNNALSGLSWANAWQSLRGLRTAGVVPVAGDEIRFARSEEYTPANGQYTYGFYSQQLWTMYGVTIMDTWESSGVNRYRTYNSAASYERYPFPPGIPPLSGVVTAGAPGTSGYYPIWGNAPAGEMNAPSTQLFGATMSLSGPTALDKSRVSGHIRCRTAYTGAGDVDLPAGAISLVLMNGASVVRELALPAIRNSTVEWTPFEIDFTALPNAPITAVWLARTAVTLTRDTSPFGLELSEMVLSHANAVRTADTVFRFGRNSYTSGRSEEVVGSNNIRPVGEALNPLDASGSWFRVSIGGDANDRTQTAVGASVRASIVPEVPWVGTGGQSPLGSLGVFDLNGSTGGAVGNPVKLTGGWNTGTDTVDGLTAFSAGLDPKYGSQFALFDMNGADHIKVENISAAYGFSSFFTRAKTVHLLKCSLPFSLHPAFGAATVDTHVTLETMYVAPILLEGYGTIGDLTLTDFYYASNMNTLQERRNEVRHLTMTSAQLGRYWLVPNTFHKTTYCRGNAVLDQCCLSYPPRLVSIQFGNTLTFQNHKAYTGGTYQAFLIPTAPESRWDHILYSDATMPTYGFFSLQPTEVTCDAKVSITAVGLWASDVAAANFYPTALRGHHVNGQYVDGVNFFGATIIPPMRGQYAAWEVQTAHAAHRTDLSPGVRPQKLATVGDIATPPWSYAATPEEPDTPVVETDPDIAPTGRIWIARRFDNVTYRTSDTVFLCSMQAVDVAQGVQWITLKAIYLPKAGLYRAHFGFMGENLDWYNGNQDTWVIQPLTLRDEFPSPADGRQMGQVAVFSGALSGLGIEVPYFAATAEEEATGGGNRNLNQWRDIFVDFEMARAGMVELRIGSTELGSFEMAIFDTLTIHERT